MLGCCKNPKCTYEYVPNQKNLANAWINDVCDVFCELVKWITNHDTPFSGAQTGVNEGPRGVNGVNSGNGGVRGSTERYGGKNNNIKNTVREGGGGRGN